MFPKEPKIELRLLDYQLLRWKVEQIAVYLKWADSTVRTAIHRWKKSGLMGLWDAPRSGRKRKWQPENMEEITKKLDKEQNRTNEEKR